LPLEKFKVIFFTLTKLLLSKICVYKKEIRNGLIIQLLTVLTSSILYDFITIYHIYSSINDIFGIVTIIVLPMYFLWKAIKHKRIYGKQTATYLIFSAIFSFTALVDAYISKYYHMFDLHFLLKSFSIIGLSLHAMDDILLGLLSTPFDLLIALFMFHVLVDLWPRFRAKNIQS